LIARNSKNTYPGNWYYYVIIEDFTDVALFYPHS
jgi:hypothetical protein